MDERQYPLVVRYMGTKRHMADHVRDVISELNPNGRVVDLFSGMGSVAESLQHTRSVITNDALSFTAAFSSARFTGRQRTDKASATMERLVGAYRVRVKELKSELDDQINSENRALNAGRTALASHIEGCQHVGNNSALRRKAQQAHQLQTREHYQLAVLYFSGGYLSLKQAIEVDAIRYAIDSDESSNPEVRDWLLASWLAGLSRLINAPGHTAQFLKPNSDSAYLRIVRTWKRSVWDEFGIAMRAMQQVGCESWRVANTVLVGDALDLVSGGLINDIGAVYADPPYTKDQYSRYYHVYETLYRYDYPDSHGAGRNRSDRFTTGFCLKTAVVASFRDLCRNVSRLGVPLVISYPSAGLLADAGGSIDEITEDYFRSVDQLTFEAKHSTMGASTGQHKQLAMENLYVCRI